MLHSNLVQFGLKCIERSNVVLEIGDFDVEFGIRLYECPDSEGRIIKHAEVYRPDIQDDTSDIHHKKEELFWLRILITYQLLAQCAEQEREPSREEILGVNEVVLLGNIAIAFPPRSLYFESRTLSRKHLAAERKADQDALLDRDIVELSPASLGADDDVSTNDLLRYFRASITPEDMLSNVSTKEFGRFLSDAKAVMTDCLNNHDQWHVAHGIFHERYDAIRKDPSDADRIHLRLMQAAGATQLMRAYEIVVTEILKLPDVQALLDAVSLKHNQIWHWGQDVFGGIVPAVHPFFALVLCSKQSIACLYDLAVAQSPDNINSVNRVLVAALGFYTDTLISAYGADVSLNAVGDQIYGELAPVGVNQDALGCSRQDIVAVIRGLAAAAGMAEDTDIDIAIRILSDGIGGKTLAEELNRSPGYVSKHKDKGLIKIRKLLAGENLGFAELMASYNQIRKTASASSSKVDAPVDESLADAETGTQYLEKLGKSRLS